jgi:hypothetical protein
MPNRDETVASQIWPHLAADRPAPSTQPQRPNALAAAMYPSLAKAAKPQLPKAYQAYREGVLRSLRESRGR